VYAKRKAVRIIIYVFDLYNVKNDTICFIHIGLSIIIAQQLSDKEIFDNNLKLFSIKSYSSGKIAIIYEIFSTNYNQKNTSTYSKRYKLSVSTPKFLNNPEIDNKTGIFSFSNDINDSINAKGFSPNNNVRTEVFPQQFFKIPNF